MPFKMNVFKAEGQAADAEFVKWLMDHQKEAGVFMTVSGLVEQFTVNPAAKMTAQEIAQRVQQAAPRSAHYILEGQVGSAVEAKGNGDPSHRGAECQPDGGGALGESIKRKAESRV